MSDAVGIMSGAFFVSRGELLSWLNDFLKLGYSRVEQVADGSAHCQVFDALFPGKVPLHKVNFGARHEYEFVQNYKILQAVLDKVGIEKHIEVERLIKARAQDNLEFLQWVKAVFDRFYAGQPYDAIERRETARRKYREQKAGFVGSGASAVAKRRPVSTGKRTPILGAPAVRSTQPPRLKTMGAPARADSNTCSVQEAPRRDVTEPSERSATPARACQQDEKPDFSETKTSTSVMANAPMSDARQALLDKMTEMQVAIDNLEKERTYYFEKLRDIELLCQTHPEPELPLIKAIQAVLYDEPLNLDEESALTPLTEGAASLGLDPTDSNDREEHASLCRELHLDGRSSSAQIPHSYLASA
jgi:RP/EB family microtubule-associated protein